MKPHRSGLLWQDMVGCQHPPTFTFFTWSGVTAWQNNRWGDSNQLPLSLKPFPLVHCRPVGRGGVRALLVSKGFYILYNLSALPFEVGPLVSLLLKITAIQTSVVAAMRVWSWRTSAECAQNCLRHCNVRTRVNTSINKSLFQAFESSPVPHLLFCQH